MIAPTCEGPKVGRCAVLFSSLAIVLFASSLSNAAADISPQLPDDSISECASLDTEWKAIEPVCSTNANLGRARALAREGEAKCKAPQESQRKVGISKYRSALHLCHQVIDTR
ncbi:MAG: hypothetical protein GC190_20915 [Alphaproteobacteria bacterium]|nr:hypothetical protein [Alphaproteobacteria bacterium]